MGLSVVVGSIALVPTVLAITLRHVLHPAATGALAYVAGVGLVVSLAASDRLAPQTTWLMGKTRDGAISTPSLVALWPYHLGLRAKLWVQWKKGGTSEPLWNKVSPGM